MEAGITIQVQAPELPVDKDREGGLDESRIRAIESATEVPLVIHGGSGVPLEQRLALSQHVYDNQDFDDMDFVKMEDLK